jgi:hypothetical protein
MELLRRATKYRLLKMDSSTIKNGTLIKVVSNAVVLLLIDRKPFFVKLDRTTNTIFAPRDNLANILTEELRF